MGCPAENNTDSTSFLDFVVTKAPSYN